MSSPNLERRRSSSANAKERFPDLDPTQSGAYSSDYNDSEHGRNASVRTLNPVKSSGVLHSERWQTWKGNHLAWGDGPLNVAGPRNHGRHRSISDAFRSIRTRKASVSENAHEIAEALKAPVSLKILVSDLAELKMHQLIDHTGALLDLVLELRLDQYLLQVHP